MSGDQLHHYMSQFDPTAPIWQYETKEQQAARAKAQRRHNLAVLVCVCAVALATLALWRMGPMPEGLL